MCCCGHLGNAEQRFDSHIRWFQFASVRRFTMKRSLADMISWMMRNESYQHKAFIYSDC